VSQAPSAGVRGAVKALVDACALAAMSPAIAAAACERRFVPGGESIFGFCAHLAAWLPGPPGMALRRAFYRGTLNSCARDFYIGFGSLFTHRNAMVEQGAYVGAYALIGCARLRRGCLIGSRASLLSGGALHQLLPDGSWSPADHSRLQQIEIGAHAWVGEGAIVMADVGAKAMVAAGAVVSTAVPPRAMVAGNPARFVRMLEPPMAAVTEQQHAAGI
jgi:acetyltransferase-like isoleucine patch superfamily enzyme